MNPKPQNPKLCTLSPRSQIAHGVPLARLRQDQGQGEKQRPPCCWGGGVALMIWGLGYIGLGFRVYIEYVGYIGYIGFSVWSLGYLGYIGYIRYTGFGV